MARHNLAGWCRDVQSLLRTGTDGELEDFFALWTDVEERVEDWLDVGIRKDSSDVESSVDDADGAVDDGQDDLDGDNAGAREADAPRARRHDAGSEALRAAPSGLGRELASLPGRQRSQAEPDQPDVRSGSVGSSCFGVAVRQAFVAQPPDSMPVGNRATPRPRSVPRGTRKGVSRGKKSSKKR